MTFIIITMAALSGWGIRKAAADILRERERQRRRQEAVRRTAQRAADRERRESAWKNIRDVRPGEETRIVPVFVRAVK